MYILKQLLMYYYNDSEWIATLDDIKYETNIGKLVIKFNINDNLNVENGKKRYTILKTKMKQVNYL